MKLYFFSVMKNPMKKAMYTMNKKFAENGERRKS